MRCRGNLQALHLVLTWTAWCSPCSTTTTCTRSDTCIDSLVDRWARADAQASGANAGCMSEPRLDNAALSSASAMDTARAWRLSHTEGVLDSVVGGREGEINSTCRQQVGRACWCAGGCCSTFCQLLSCCVPDGFVETPVHEPHLMRSWESRKPQACLLLCRIPRHPSDAAMKKGALLSGAHGIPPTQSKQAGTTHQKQRPLHLCVKR